MLLTVVMKLLTENRIKKFFPAFRDGRIFIRDIKLKGGFCEIGFRDLGKTIRLGAVSSIDLTLTQKSKGEWMFRNQILVIKNFVLLNACSYDFIPYVFIQGVPDFLMKISFRENSSAHYEILS